MFHHVLDILTIYFKISGNLKKAFVKKTMKLRITKILLLLCLFTSCRSVQPCVVGTNTHDSVYVYVENTDTIVVVEPDSASMMALLECDSMGNMLLRELEQEQGRNIALSATLKGNVLTVDCKQDSLQQLVNRLREVVREYETNDTKEVVTVEVVTKYYRFTSWAFWIVVAILLIRIAWWLAKKYYGR